MGKNLKSFPRASAQITPPASAGKSQIKRTQLRAKIGATGTGEEKLFAGQIAAVAAAEKNINSAVGTGDKTWFSAPTRTLVAGVGADGADFSEQQAILPPQLQQAFAGWPQILAAAAGNNCPSSSDTLQMMAKIAFTKLVSPDFD